MPSRNASTHIGIHFLLCRKMNELGFSICLALFLQPDEVAHDLSHVRLVHPIQQKMSPKQRMVKVNGS